MNQKQTAVDFIVEWLANIDWDDPHFKNILQEAKQMEKEQIENAFYQGVDRESDHHGAGYLGKEDAEQYYNETYGGAK